MKASLIVTAVCFSILSIARAEDVSAAMRKSIHIPPEDMSTALRAVAQQRELYVIFAARDVESLRTSGATGVLDADEIFQQLLRGSGLIHRFIDDKTVMILPEHAARTSAADDDTAWLGSKPRRPREMNPPGPAFAWLKRLREALRRMLP